MTLPSSRLSAFEDFLRSQSFTSARPNWLHRFLVVAASIALVGVTETVSAQALGSKGLQNFGGQEGQMSEEDYGMEEEYGMDDEMGMEDEMGMDDMDMEMDGYGGGSGGGYGGRSQRGSAAGPPSDLMDLYGATLASVRDRIDLSPLFSANADPEVETGPVLGRDAEDAFKAGNQALAAELMFGHMAVEHQDAMVALQTVKYSPMLRRPVWSIRWGVSLAIRGDSSSDPKPIREGATPMGRPGNSRGGRGLGGQGGGDFGMGMEDMSMGMEDMSMGMEEMGMGMDDMSMGMEEMGYGRGSGGGQRQTRRSQPSIPQRSMLSEKAKERLDKYLGLVALVSGEQFKKRFQQGDFGPVFASVSAPTPAEPVRGGGRSAAAPATPSMSAELNELFLESGESLFMWQPGVVFLGEGTSEEIMEAAKAANLDLVLHFDVVLKAGRNESMQNISRARLLHVAASKSAGVSKSMDSFEASQFASAGRMDEREYVEGQLSNLFGIVDRQAKVVDMPGLTPEIARRRVSALIASPRSRSLRTLAEIRMYQVKQLLTDEEVEAAFDIVGGEEALTLLHGPKQERIKIARKWALESVPDVVAD
jgi:hypothetical protein